MTDMLARGPALATKLPNVESSNLSVKIKPSICEKRYEDLPVGAMHLHRQYQP